jgi:hypothetical protein
MKEDAIQESERGAKEKNEKVGDIETLESERPR